MTRLPQFLKASVAFLKSRLVVTHTALWRIMLMLRPYKYAIVLANVLLFLASTMSALALGAMVPFLNELFARWDTARSAEAPASAIEKRIEDMPGGAPPEAGTPEAGTPETSAAPLDAKQKTRQEREAKHAARRAQVEDFVSRHPTLGKIKDTASNAYKSFMSWARTSTERYILFFAGFMLLLLLVGGAFQFGGDLMMAKVGISLTSDLLRNIYANVLRQEMMFFDRTTTGTLINTCYREVFMIRPMVQLLASTRPLLPLKMLILFSLCLFISWQLSLLLLFLLPVVILPTMLLTRRLKKAMAMELEGEALPITIMTEAFQGIRAIKAFGAERLEQRYLEPAIEGYVQMTERRRKAESVIGPVVDLLNMVMVLSVFVSAFLFLGERLNMQPGTLAGFLFALTRFYKPFRSLMTMNIRMQRSNAVARRIFHYLDRQPQVREDPEPVAFPADWQQLVLDEVYLSYIVMRRGQERTRKVLRGANMQVGRGEMVALVGPNGAGKSSIVNLICRLYDVSSGEIRFDDTPLKKMRIEDLRERICLITQHPILFNRSISENIAFGMEGLTHEQIVEAAKATGCHGFVMAMPDGYDSEVGEQGCLLSGGERQKIVLARAFVRKPDILILDEPTTGLDHETLAEFLHLIAEIRDRRDTTIIYITHDRSQLEMFDRIYAFTEEKRLQEVASVAELEALAREPSAV